MDWRSGGRQNPTGSAFRGISSRSRGRGRGRGLSPRGGHAGTPHATSPSVTPALPSQLPLPPPPPLPAPPPTAPPPVTKPTPSKSPSRRGSHQPSRQTSVSHPDTSRAPIVPPVEVNTQPSGRPQVTRRVPPSFSGITTPSSPSLKLDQSSQTTPGTSRPKTPRKRSHHRGRSSSKTSSTPQASSTALPDSVKEKNKEIPPHMALTSGPSDIQSFDPRTDIDILVERVRAMAMAGSAMDKDKDKQGNVNPHDGHIDWAGDEDDTLPDLDDWVRPKPVQNKETKLSELDPPSDKPFLPSVEEVVSLNLPSADKRIQDTSELNELKSQDNAQQPQDGRGPMKFKPAFKEAEAIPGKPKSRGRHGRKKSTVSDAVVPTPATKTSVSSEVQSPEAPSPTKSLPPLVHPLPPKPQLPAAPVRGFRSRGPVHTNQPVTRTSDKDNTSDEVLSAAPRKDDSMECPSTEAAKPIVETENKAASACPEPQVRKRAFDPSVDWANAPRESLTVESVREAEVLEAPSSNTGYAPDANTRRRAFDPSVDWSKAPNTPNLSPMRRSPSRPARSPVPSSGISSTSASGYARTARPHDRSRGPYRHHNLSPRSSAGTSPQPPPHSRSQMNSPERSPHRWQDRMGPTHLRAHSSPQTGPGTRTHTSRPVITLDALSRISRTLGVSGATTPPRGPAPEVVVAD